MSDPENYELIVTYTDGSRQSFKFPRQVDKIKVSHFVERLLQAPTLSLQMNDSLLVIPAANIRSAEIRPMPAILPDIVLHKVERAAEVM